MSPLHLRWAGQAFSPPRPRADGVPRSPPHRSWRSPPRTGQLVPNPYGARRAHPLRLEGLSLLLLLPSPCKRPCVYCPRALHQRRASPSAAAPAAAAEFAYNSFSDLAAAHVLAQPNFSGREAGADGRGAGWRPRGVMHAGALPCRSAVPPAHRPDASRACAPLPHVAACTVPEPGEPLSACQAVRGSGRPRCLSRLPWPDQPATPARLPGGASAVPAAGALLHVQGDPEDAATGYGAYFFFHMDLEIECPGPSPADVRCPPAPCVAPAAAVRTTGPRCRRCQRCCAEAPPMAGRHLGSQLQDFRRGELNHARQPVE